MVQAVRRRKEKKDGTHRACSPCATPLAEALVLHAFILILAKPV